MGGMCKSAGILESKCLVLGGSVHVCVREVCFLEQMGGRDDVFARKLVFLGANAILLGKKRYLRANEWPNS